MVIIKRTGQDEGDEPKEPVAAHPHYDAREHEMPSERLDIGHANRFLLQTSVHFNLLRTTRVTTQTHTPFILSGSINE